jgi:hypothetical protein
MERHNAQQAAGEEKAAIKKCESFVRRRDGDAVDTCFQRISLNSSHTWTQFWKGSRCRIVKSQVRTRLMTMSLERSYCKLLHLRILYHVLFISR